MTSDNALSALENADLVVLGRRLRDARRTAGLTQQDLAAGDISGAYVSRIEAGQRRPEFSVARRLADRLGTTVEFLATGVEPADRHEAEMSVRYAELALRSGEVQEAADQLQAMVDAGPPTGAIGMQVSYLLGLAREALGELEAAAVLLEETLRQSSGIFGLQVAMALCRCYRDAGDLSRAIQVGETARASAEADGLLGVDDEIRLTLTLVAAYHTRGDVVYASQLCQRAIARAETQQSTTARAAAYWNASVIAANRGASKDALVMADRALALLSESDDQRGLARLKLQHGVIVLAQDEPDFGLALNRLELAREALTGTNAGAADIATCDIALGRAYFGLGELDEATRRATAGVSLLGATAPLVQAEGLVLLGRVAGAQGDLEDAQRLFRSAVATLTAATADREAAQLWYELGGLLEQAGDDSGARDAYRSAAASLGMRQASTFVKA